MDRGAWWAIVHEVAKSQTRLSKHAVTESFLKKKCKVSESGEIPVPLVKNFAAGITPLISPSLALKLIQNSEMTS